MALATKLHRLYIDETGVPNFTALDKNYTLCGVIVRSYQSEDLRIRADQIKFKYWGNTNVVFHSKDIGKKQNEFSILNNPNINKSFLGDLNTGQYKCIVVSVNKDKAQQQGWNQTQIQNSAVDKMLEFFVAFLLKLNNVSSTIISIFYFNMKIFSSWQRCYLVH